MYERFPMSLGEFAPKVVIIALHVFGVIMAVAGAIAFIAGEGERALLGLMPELLLTVLLRAEPRAAPERNFVEIREQSMLVQLHSLPWPITTEIPFSSMTAVEANVLHSNRLARRMPGWREEPHIDLQFTAASIRWGPIPWPSVSRRLHLFITDSERLVARLRSMMAGGGSPADTP